MKKDKKYIQKAFTIVMILFILALIHDNINKNTDRKNSNEQSIEVQEQINKKSETVIENSDFGSINIPDYDNQPYTVINDNKTFIKNEELTTEAFERYSPKDNLGRVGVAYANICKEIMPTEKRGEIGSVKPTGWVQNKYPGLVDGNYIYNRCHLIGYQLAGENANDENLMTGTRYFNVEGMLPWENKVADYVNRTNNHVLYRVTPIFDGNNLLASGVIMEAKSVEDTDLEFCVYVYNVQPGIYIDYTNGDNWKADTIQSQ